MKGRYGSPALTWTLAVALVLLVASFTNAYAQTGRITGKVTDSGIGGTARVRERGGYGDERSAP